MTFLHMAASVAGTDVFYKGMDYRGDAVTAVPGYASTRVAEAAEYAVPALYSFTFDLSALHRVPTVNGMDEDPHVRSLDPGAVGEEDPHEVIVNVPVEMRLLKGDDLVSALSEISGDAVSSDPIQALHYVVETSLENADRLGLDEAMRRELEEMVGGVGGVGGDAFG